MLHSTHMPEEAVAQKLPLSVRVNRHPPTAMCISKTRWRRTLVESSPAPTRRRLRQFLVRLGSPLVM